MEIQRLLLTISDQLKTIAAEVSEQQRKQQAQAAAQQPTTEKRETRRVYGLNGIAELFHVSRPTAQRYKKTFLAPAVSQRGRKITTDVDLALQLFKEAASD